MCPYMERIEMFSSNNFRNGRNNERSSQEDVKNRDVKKKKLHKKLFAKNETNYYLEDAEEYLDYLIKINASEEEIANARLTIAKEKMLEER